MTTDPAPISPGGFARGGTAVDVGAPFKSGAEEVARLRGCLNDLVSVMAGPALGTSGGPPHTVSALLDALLGIARQLDERFAQQTREIGLANDALRESERNSRLLVDSIPGLVALLSAGGEVEFVNRQIVEYTGRALEELKRWGTDDTVHPEDLPHVIQAFTQSIASGSPYEILQRLRRSDGVYLWFQNNGFPLRDASGHIVRWCVLLTDVDERKRAEDALHASERSLKLIIDTIPALAWSARPDGSAEFFNQLYLDFIGLSEEQASGWGWTAAVHPEDLNGLAATWQQIRASAAPGEAEARLRRHDGDYRWFLFRANPLRDETGAIVTWYGVNTDMEDRKQAEAELRRAYTEMKVAEEALSRAGTELAHVSRVTTLNALTASIAHEVNQPLSGIITNAGTCLRMLDAEPPNIEGARETARRTIRDGRLAADVITRLRALFSRREFTLEPLDLNEATREVIALSSSDLQRNRIMLQSELADDLPAVTGDRIQLQQVILNLLRNASDAMIGVHDRPRRLLIKTERDDDERVRLSVRDAGVGLSSQNLDSLFHPFHTTKSGGMGIGLFVSRSIVESHQGRLWAESNDGGPGATFAFSVPRVPEGTLDEAPRGAC
jgi:PAS domain S-box-containing protein